jgi:hypothetical protein
MEWHLGEGVVLSTGIEEPEVDGTGNGEPELIRSEGERTDDLGSLASEGQRTDNQRLPGSKGQNTDNQSQLEKNTDNRASKVIQWNRNWKQGIYIYSGSKQPEVVETLVSFEPTNGDVAFDVRL